MEYKMICIDVDGTLLNSRNELSTAVKQAIYRITFDKYVPVILVSARPPQGMEFLQEELDIMRPMICYSGAMIVQDDVLHNIGMSAQAARYAVDLAARADVSVCLCSGWNWYAEKMDSYIKDESTLLRSTPGIVPFPTLLEGMGESQQVVHKILCMGEEAEIVDLEQRMLADNAGEFDICRSLANSLEIMPAGVDKAAAIDKVANLYGYSLRDVLAIGDNYNDIPMLKAVGLGLAMGNAPDEVKAAAGAVAPDNDQDGVAWAIGEYL